MLYCGPVNSLHGCRNVYTAALDAFRVGNVSAVDRKLIVIEIALAIVKH
jgi:hypothetical protein